MNQGHGRMKMVRLWERGTSPTCQAWQKGLLMLVLVGLLAACRMPYEPDAQMADPPAAATPEPVATPVPEEPTPAPTPEAEAAETAPEVQEPTPEADVPAVADWTQHVWVDGPYYVMGNPDAPVTIIDVSDFL